MVLFEASSYTVKFFNFAGNGLNTASVGESKSNTHQVESGDDRGKWVATLAMPTNTSAINYTTGKGLTAPDGSTYDPAGDSDWSFDGWYNGYDADGNGTKSSDTSDKTCTDLNGQIKGNETLYSDYNVYAKWSRKLAVTKTFEGLDAADRPTDFGIQISDSDSNVKANLSLTDATTSNGGKTYTWKVSGLALNGEYTVTENPGTAPTNFELKEVKIRETTTEPVDGKYSTTIQFTKNSGAVAFTNTYQRQDAYLLIEKKISDASDGWNASDDFYFNVKVGEQNDAYAEMLTYSIGNISDMAAGAKAKDLVTATATKLTGSSGSYTVSTKGQTYIAVKLPKAAGLTVSVGELANATETVAMSANSKTDNGYTLLSITDGSQTLDGTDAGKTAVFTNEKKFRTRLV